MIKPVDLYRRRVYLEPLGLYLQLYAGTFEAVTFDKDTRLITLEFSDASHDTYPYKTRRLTVEKMADSRPGSNFKMTYPVVRNAFVIPADETKAVITYTV